MEIRSIQDKLFTIILEIDPRSKFIWFIAYSAVFFTNNCGLLIWLFFSCLIIFYICRAHRTIYFKIWKYLIIIFLVIIILAIWESPDIKGIETGLIIICKWAIVTLASIAFFAISRPFEMLTVLSWLRVPRGFCFALGIGFRFLPIVFEEGDQILMAQRARGLNARRGLAAILNLPVVFYSLSIPLMIGMLSRLNSLWLTLRIRGFTLDEGVAPKPFKLTALNISVILYSLIILTLYFYL